MLRPPREAKMRVPDNPQAALEYELAQEKASALGRLGRALEEALARLAAFDAAPAGPAGERGALVAEASVALWHLVIQREALGLRDTVTLMRDYGVPPEVRNRMGALSPKP